MILYDKITLIFGILVLVIAGCTKEKPIPEQKNEFYKSFSGSNGATAVDFLSLDDGYLVLGNLIDEDDNSTILLIKTDQFGNVVWQKTYNNDEKSKFSNQIIKINDSEDFAIVGSIISDTDSLYQDVILLIVNSIGEVMNTVVFEQTKIEEGKGIISNNTGFILAAEEFNLQGDTINILFYQLDNEGNTLKKPFKRTDDVIFQGYKSVVDQTGYFIGFNGNYPGIYTGIPSEPIIGPILIPINGEIKAIAESTDGDLYVCGYVNQGENGGNDAYIAKISQLESADYDWIAYFGNAGDDIFNCLCITENNELLAVGASENNQINTTDIYVVKTSLDGVLINEKFIGGENNETGTGILTESNDQFVILSETYFEENKMISIIKQSFE